MSFSYHPLCCVCVCVYVCVCVFVCVRERERVREYRSGRKLQLERTRVNSAFNPNPNPQTHTHTHTHTHTRSRKRREQTCVCRCHGDHISVQLCPRHKLTNPARVCLRVSRITEETEFEYYYGMWPLLRQPQSDTSLFLQEPELACVHPNQMQTRCEQVHVLVHA